VWERSDFGVAGKGVRAVLVFVKTATYRKRLDFFGVTSHAIDTTLGPQFDREFSKVSP
jgi:hypothetical protein